MPNLPAQVITPDHACRLVRSKGAGLVAIDGFPCSGKSTLANRLETELGFQSVPIDDFFLPPADWPTGIVASFPFPFFRYSEFLAAVEELALHGSCEYLPFDWGSMRISESPRLVRSSDAPIVIEGTSTLHPRIAPRFDIRLFVESDSPSALRAILKRDGNHFRKEWQTLWLPSAEIYMGTCPRARADHLIRGRGITFPAQAPLQPS